MRIVHTALRYPPASGGVEDYLEQVVARTRDIDAGRDVRVLTSKLRTHHPAEELNPDLLVDDAPYVQRLHHSTTPFIAYPRLKGLSYYLRHHKPDIIHAHSFWYQPADVAAKYAKENNIPFILQPFFYSNEIREKAIWQLYKKTIGRKTFEQADAVIVISPFEQKLVEKKGFKVKKFVLAPPGINFEEFKQQHPNPFTKRGIKGKVVLAVSRVAPGKGLDDAVKAFSEVKRKQPDVDLVIVGEDFGEKEKLEQLVKSQNLENSVHFFGKLGRGELVACYQHADVFVHPSHYEAFGIVLAESLSAGTPVVARNVAAIPYVVPHEKAGLLFNNVDEMVDQLLLLLSNSELAGRYAAAGKKHVLENFNWDSTIKKITSVYNEITRRGNSK